MFDGGPPSVGDGLVTRNSSPAISNGRVCTVPSRLGYVLPSNRMVNVFFASSTVYVPKLETFQSTAALFSSDVPLARLFEANFGRSERIRCEE